MPLPRYRRPKIAPIGRAAKRKWPTRQQAYAAVSRRAKGRCELCGAAQDPLDPHHVFGRGHLHGIPADLCDTSDLILGVCRDCHDGITGLPGFGVDEYRDHQAKWLAVQRFAAHHLLEESGDPDPLVVMRRLVREFEEKEDAA